MKSKQHLVCSGWRLALTCLLFWCSDGSTWNKFAQPAIQPASYHNDLTAKFAAFLLLASETKTFRGLLFCLDCWLSGNTCSGQSGFVWLTKKTPESQRDNLNFWGRVLPKLKYICFYLEITITSFLKYFFISLYYLFLGITKSVL